MTAVLCKTRVEVERNEYNEGLVINEKWRYHVMSQNNLKLRKLNKFER